MTEIEGQWPAVIMRVETDCEDQPLNFEWSCYQKFHRFGDTPAPGDDGVCPESMPAVALQRIEGRDPEWVWLYFDGCDDESPDVLDVAPDDEAGAAMALWERGAPYWWEDRP